MMGLYDKNVSICNKNRKYFHMIYAWYLWYFFQLLMLLGTQESGFLECLSVRLQSLWFATLSPIMLMTIPVVKPGSHNLDILNGPSGRHLAIGL